MRVLPVLGPHERTDGPEVMASFYGGTCNKLMENILET